MELCGIILITLPGISTWTDLPDIGVSRAPSFFRDRCGGNVMVFSNNPPSLLYPDCEAMGCHMPFLDFAKSIYKDCFLNATYDDLLYEKLLRQDDNGYI